MPIVVAESHQSPRASSRDRSCSPRATATRGRCGPTAPDVGGKHNRRRGRREAPHAKTPRAAKSRLPRTSTRVACLLERVQTSSPTAARPLPHEPSRWVAHRRPAAAVPSGGAEMPIEAAHGAAAAACATLPTASSYPGILPRPCRARRCGAGSGFYSASGTISPIYGRSKEKKIGVR